MSYSDGIGDSGRDGKPGCVGSLYIHARRLSRGRMQYQSIQRSSNNLAPVHGVLAPSSHITPAQPVSLCRLTDPPPLP